MIAVSRICASSSASLGGRTRVRARARRMRGSGAGCMTSRTSRMPARSVLPFALGRRGNSAGCGSACAGSAEASVDLAAAFRPQHHGAAAEAVLHRAGGTAEIGCAVSGAARNSNWMSGSASSLRLLDEAPCTPPGMSLARLVPKQIGCGERHRDAVEPHRAVKRPRPAAARTGSPPRRGPADFADAGSATCGSMPCARSASGSPMPDSISTCGELMTPPASSTSRSARSDRGCRRPGGIRRRRRGCPRARCATPARRSRP